MRLRKLLPLLGLLLFVTPTSASVAWVQCNHNDSTSGVSTVTTTISPTAGNALLVGYFIFSNQSLTSIKDSAGNSFTIDNNVVIGTRVMVLAHLTNIASGLTGVTAIHGGSNDSAALTVCEYSGLAVSPTDAIDTVGTSSTNGTWATNAMTPSAGLNEAIIGYVVDRTGTAAVTCTAAGFTRRISAAGANSGETIAWCEDIVASTSGSYTPSGTGNNGDALFADGITFKAAAAGGGGGGGFGGKAGIGGKAGFGFWHKAFRLR
jgi:hypothetical protein